MGLGSFSFLVDVLDVFKQLRAAVTILYNEELRFCPDDSLLVSTVLTDNRREFCGCETYS